MQGDSMDIRKLDREAVVVPSLAGDDEVSHEQSVKENQEALLYETVGALMPDATRRVIKRAQAGGEAVDPLTLAKAIGTDVAELVALPFMAAKDAIDIALHSLFAGFSMD